MREPGTRRRCTRWSGPCRRGPAERASRPGRAWAGLCAVADYLRRKLPGQAACTSCTSRLGTPRPSEGVIINADGQLVDPGGRLRRRPLPAVQPEEPEGAEGRGVHPEPLGGWADQRGHLHRADLGCSSGHGGLALGHVHDGVRAGLPGWSSAQRQGRADDPPLRAAAGRGAVRAGGPAARSRRRWKERSSRRCRATSTAGTRRKEIQQDEIEARMKEFKENPKIEGRDEERAEQMASATSRSGRRGERSPTRTPRTTGPRSSTSSTT